MIAAIAAILLIPVFLVYCYKNAYVRPANFPPGPPNLPIYGGFWFVLAHEFSNLPVAFRKLGKRYKTNIIGLFMGPVPTVVLNDPALIKEMLFREEFDGRMDIILARLRSYWKKLGIFFTDGYFWHVQRRFSLRYLRDYGFGRRDATLEDVVANEIKEMIDMRLGGPKYPAEKEVVNGELVYLPHYFSVPFINGMLHVMTRMTLPRHNYYPLWELSKGTLIFQRNSNDMGGALSLTPWLKDIMPNYSGFRGLVKGNQYLLDFFEKLVAEVMSTHDESYDRHFLDMYISKMKEELRQDGRTTYSGITCTSACNITQEQLEIHKECMLDHPDIVKRLLKMEQLILTCVDYMFPAASAVESVLTMLVERLLIQPELQDKIHEEIDRVVGRDRLPNLDDRSNMPYTEACIREAMRFDSLVPLGVPHRAMQDTTIGGYSVPEGSMVSANYMMLHMDEKIWGDPENFRPDRFIVDGQLNVASDKSLPFGAGRRLCAGETYARQSMFQVFTGFMQAFHVTTPDGKPLKKPAERIQGIITTIPEFWVRTIPRS